jgi:hypothetical protein
MNLRKIALEHPTRPKYNPTIQLEGRPIYGTTDLGATILIAVAPKEYHYMVASAIAAWYNCKLEGEPTIT